MKSLLNFEIERMGVFGGGLGNFPPAKSCKPLNYNVKLSTKLQFPSTYLTLRNTKILPVAHLAFINFSKGFGGRVREHPRNPMLKCVLEIVMGNYTFMYFSQIITGILCILPLPQTTFLDTPI